MLMRDGEDIEDAGDVDAADGIADEEELLARQIYMELGGGGEGEGSASEEEEREREQERKQLSEAPVDEAAAAEKDEGEAAPPTIPTPPPRRRPGRPRKTSRTPSPPRLLAPFERFFAQNRPGSTKTSSHNLNAFTPLTHAEYFSTLSTYTEPHAAEIAHLQALQERAFAQWAFELGEGFGICLHGFGGKGAVLGGFAAFLAGRNGRGGGGGGGGAVVLARAYLPRLDLRTLLANVLAALGHEESDEAVERPLPAKPHEALSSVLQRLNALPATHAPLTLLLHALDRSPTLLAPQNLPLLLTLLSHHRIHALFSTTHPALTLLLAPAQRRRLNLLFHDCTTFAGVGAEELDVVAVVDELLGRGARAVRGKAGVGFVLKSLTENARRLFALLAREQLGAEALEAGGNRGQDEDEEGEGGDGDGDGEGSRGVGMGAMEYRAVYRRSVEEFVCSSEGAFRTLLKEFHDHRMVDSRREAGGAEVLRLPFRRQELESILEDLG